VSAEALLFAEPDSLAIDAASLGAAAKAIANSSGPVMTYVQAVRAIPMGEQPIIVSGNVAGHYDVLSKRPELKSALYAAIRRGDEIAGHMSTLHDWAAGGARKIAGMVTPSLESLRAILASVPSGGTMSDSDVVRAREQMQIAWVNTMMVSMGINQIGSGINNFLSNIIVDHDTLARGPLELNKVGQEIGKQISDEAMKYVLNPMARGIGETILQIGRAFIATTDRVGGVIGNAMLGHEAMRGGASALATAATTARAKYEAAASAFYRADSATMSTTLRKLQLTTSIQSWNQFAEFFERSGL
jgi:hypothetical protein